MSSQIGAGMLFKGTDPRATVLPLPDLAKQKKGLMTLTKKSVMPQDSF
jgi:hypothetical protein